jgi:hypothetical protein
MVGSGDAFPDDLPPVLQSGSPFQLGIVRSLASKAVFRRRFTLTPVRPFLKTHATTGGECSPQNPISI